MVFSVLLYLYSSSLNIYFASTVYDRAAIISGALLVATTEEINLP